MAEWHDIYDYWFGAPGGVGHGEVREFWFASTPAIDREIEDRFLDRHEQAKGGGFGDWKSNARGWVALIVLLDQVPRNVFRGNPRSFAADPVALAAAKQLVASPRHGELLTVEKLFAYLPFEHSENLDDQEKCVALFEAIDDHESKAEWIEYAVAHRDIVAQFGRFPHRNAILGRQSTPAEEAWLEASDQRFGTVPEGDDQQ